MTPKISIITVTYNCVASIERTIHSVLSQDYCNIEYIIVDGASSDGTLDVINKYEDRIDVIYSAPDAGVYDAMNKAAKMATGDWINYMNAGDKFVSDNTVSKLFDIELDNTGVLFGDTISVGKEKTVEIRYNPNFWKHKLMPSCHQSIFVRRDILLDTPFDLSYKVCADCDSFVRMRKAGVQFTYNPVLVAEYDTASEGVSRERPNLYYEELLSIRYPDATKAKVALSLVKIRWAMSNLYHRMLKWKQ